MHATPLLQSFKLMNKILTRISQTNMANIPVHNFVTIFQVTAHKYCQFADSSGKQKNIWNSDVLTLWENKGNIRCGCSHESLSQHKIIAWIGQMFDRIGLGCSYKKGNPFVYSRSLKTDSKERLAQTLISKWSRYIEKKITVSDKSGFRASHPIVHAHNLGSEPPKEPNKRVTRWYSERVPEPTASAWPALPLTIPVHLCGKDAWTYPTNWID